MGSTRPAVSSVQLALPGAHHEAVGCSIRVPAGVECGVAPCHSNTKPPRRPQPRRRSRPVLLLVEETQEVRPWGLRLRTPQVRRLQEVQALGIRTLDGLHEETSLYLRNLVNINMRIFDFIRQIKMKY